MSRETENKYFIPMKGVGVSPIKSITEGMTKKEMLITQSDMTFPIMWYGEITVAIKDEKNLDKFKEMIDILYTCKCAIQLVSKS